MYRSAHDHSCGPHPAACAAQGSAAGGTVGGSADGLDVRLGSRGRTDVGEAQSTGSVGAPCRQPRAGYKYWAGLRRGRPVIICDKLQQVFVEYVEVPQLQFIDSMVIFPVASQRQVRTVQNCADGVRFHRCSSWGLSTCPFVVPDKCMIQTVQKTAEFAVCGGCRARRCATTVPGLVQTVLKLWRFPQLCTE